MNKIFTNIFIFVVYVFNAVFIHAADNYITTAELLSEMSLKKEYGVTFSNYNEDTVEDSEFPLDRKGHRLPSTSISLSPNVDPIEVDNSKIDNRCMDLVCGLTHLEDLEIVDYIFRDESFSFDINKLKKLKCLRILKCKSIPVSFFEQIAKSTTIQFIEFDDSINTEQLKICLSSMKLKEVKYPFDDITIKLLLPYQKWIISLIVTSQNLSFEATDIIKQLTNLKMLQIAGENVDDDFIKEISTLNRMECLIISHTNISDKSIEYIETWKSLKEVLVPLSFEQGTKISKDGYKRLAKIKNKVIWYDKIPFCIHGIDYN